MIKALDVTDEVKPSLPGVADRRVALSAGALSVVDKSDELQRLQLVTAIVARLMFDPACERSPIDAHQRVVTPPVGPRFVLIEGMTDGGDPSLVIVTFWEWALHAGKSLEPEIEVMERNAARRVLN